MGSKPTISVSADIHMCAVCIRITKAGVMGAHNEMLPASPQTTGERGRHPHGGLDMAEVTD